MRRRGWIAAVILALVIALLGNTSRIGDLFQDDIDVAQMESEIRSAYEQQLQTDARRAGLREPVNVLSVDCITKGDHDARCIAEVDGGLRGSAEMTVDIGDDGRYLWKATASDLQPSPS